MSTLLISNLGRLITGAPAGAELLGPPQAYAEPYLGYLQAQTHRTIWFAGPGDVLVLPTPVDEVFLDYATSLRGFGVGEIDVLVGDDEDLAADVRRAVTRRGTDRAWPYYHDRRTDAFLRELGLAGSGFAGQGGAELLNSKVLFRALAAGIGVPIADGRCPATAADATAWVWELVSSGRCAILKEDFHVGGLGNKVVSPVAGISSFGALGAEVCTDPAAVARVVGSRFAEETGRLVVEHYFPDSASIYAGFFVTDDGVTRYGAGEMRMMPVINGLVTPGTSVPAEFLVHAEHIAQATRAMGYRGQLSVDGIVTPAGEVFLTEFNARSGGATHNHCILRGLVGRPDRVLLDRRRCGLPPLKQLLAALDDAGIGYDPVTATGVVITVHDGGTGTQRGEFCVIAADLDTARRQEDMVLDMIEGAA
ncbi:peptide ligase PGM1-related protein [Kibdelosporangium phytohabitans]|uniref:ATP-grasp domain-containing protein n=1 Tax=Kibdelosporangium phytohabitans TaxID=860235 RepID=A0A0N9HY88_9PSEU|nr:peptide ligase PGM1-related protein [Kibdelosporangium phytohabitans]ALG08285.1 hypothetical protein AOZ06_16440 [Kibdelosporangium phytohabitans]MBE1470691.1 hypothetical protein [Kibdelosporangium phytohabitans]